MIDKEIYQAVKKYAEDNQKDVFSLTKDIAIMESAIKTQTLRIIELEQKVQYLEKIVDGIILSSCTYEK